MTLRTIGWIRSPLRDLAAAPCQGSEGAPAAWIEFDPEFAAALHGLAVGDAVVVVTWLHLGKRDVLQVHPRGDTRNPLTGVFATRSPHRPNPLGLHRAVVREIDGLRLRVEPMEALNGTPVVDVKIALD